MRIFFIGGFSTVVNYPCTLECGMVRDGICNHNNPFYMCFELDDWDNKPETERDELITKQFNIIKPICIQEGRRLVVRQS